MLRLIQNIILVYHKDDNYYDHTWLTCILNNMNSCYERYIYSNSHKRRYVSISCRAVCWFLKILINVDQNVVNRGKQATKKSERLCTSICFYKGYICVYCCNCRRETLIYIQASNGYHVQFAGMHIINRVQHRQFSGRM